MKGNEKTNGYHSFILALYWPAPCSLCRTMQHEIVLLSHTSIT